MARTSHVRFHSLATWVERKLSLLFVIVTSVRHFYSKLLQPILKRTESKTEQLGSFCNVVVGLFHGLGDEISFHIFKVDTFRREFECAFRSRTDVLSYFRGKIVDSNQITFT